MLQIHVKDPYVATCRDFLDDKECQHFIRLAQPLLVQAQVSGNKQGFHSAGRTGTNCWVPHNFDHTTMMVAQRISKLVGLPLEHAESFQLIHYDQAQEYRNHYDSWLHDGSEKSVRCMKNGGARLVTALCYLNDVELGGGTEMTRLKLTIPAEKGKLLVFHNTMSFTDPRRHINSEHAGLPVLQGEKYAFNLWFRERPRKC